ncbi:MAG: hypothetical protein FWG66_13265 [Spirochaetes bacterium]|nr:hypothetical protein [Spirochaetota bacterium]
MFKKATVIFALLAFFSAGTAFSQAPVPLDTAISNAASHFAATIPGGTVIAVLNVNSDSEALSNHVTSQLIVAVVNTGSFTVVSRGEVEFQAAQTELIFHLTGWVGPDTQGMLGHAVAADIIITGTLNRENTGNLMLTIQAVDLDSLAVRSAYSVSIAESNAEFSQTPVPLNTAISNAAGHFAATLPGGARLAIANITADSEALSEYAFDQLTIAILNTGAFTVVSRGALELQAAQAELDFHLTGLVSVDTQVMVGNAVGANIIVTGTINRESSGNLMLTVNAVDINSLAVRSAYSVSVIDSNPAPSQVPVPLDTAISSAANHFAATLPAGARPAVMDIAADTAALAAHIEIQLIVALVNTGRFLVVDRELNLLPGFIGHAVGADTIITGTIRMESTNSLRLTVRAIDLERLTIRAVYSVPVIDNW